MGTDWACIYCWEIGSSKTDIEPFSYYLIQKNLEYNKCNLMKCSQDLWPLAPLKGFWPSDLDPWESQTICSFSGSSVIPLRKSIQTRDKCTVQIGKGSLRFFLDSFAQHAYKESPIKCIPNPALALIFTSLGYASADTPRETTEPEQTLVRTQGRPSLWPQTQLCKYTETPPGFCSRLHPCPCRYG